MSSGITLAYDNAEVGSLNSQKVMVAVPLLYLFMVHLAYPDSLPLPNTEARQRGKGGDRTPQRFGEAPLSVWSCVSFQCKLPSELSCGGHHCLANTHLHDHCALFRLP